MQGTNPSRPRFLIRKTGLPRTQPPGPVRGSKGTIRSECLAPHVALENRSAKTSCGSVWSGDTESRRYHKCDYFPLFPNAGWGRSTRHARRAHISRWSGPDVTTPIRLWCSAPLTLSCSSLRWGPLRVSCHRRKTCVPGPIRHWGRRGGQTQSCHSTLESSNSTHPTKDVKPLKGLVLPQCSEFHCVHVKKTSSNMKRKRGER